MPSRHSVRLKVSQSGRITNGQLRLLQRLPHYRHRAYQYLVAARSNDQGLRRRECVLNSLLCGLMLAFVIAAFYALTQRHSTGTLLHGNTLSSISLLLGVMFGLWRLSRTGHYLVAAYIFLACLAFVVLRLTLTWSFELPSADLGAGLLVVITGMVLGRRTAYLMTIVIIACFSLIAQAQIAGLLHPDTSWLNEALNSSNAIDYGLMLAAIGFVSWLANGEIDRSLRRAQRTKATLARERDSLETKVMERTQELEQTQALRLLELQRFAEFGRLSAQLLHEVGNPLTAVSLNLGQLDFQQSFALRQARKSLQQLERYVGAARKQLQTQSQPVYFSAQAELKQLLAILMPLARQADVSLSVEKSEPMRLYGDPVKFNQIVANLVANAIDAYADQVTMGTPRRIIVSLQRSGRALQLTVQDWGKGIEPEQLPRLFEPFYTTKSTANRGLGIGLAIVRQMVEKDFYGTIMVDSSPRCGTTFTVTLQLQASFNHQLLKIRPVSPAIARRAFAARSN